MRSLDRRNSQARCEYFRDPLGISWLEGAIVLLLEGVLELRIEILHGNSDQIVKEPELGSIVTVNAHDKTEANSAVTAV